MQARGNNESRLETQEYDSTNHYGDSFEPLPPGGMKNYEGTPGTLFDPVHAPDNEDYHGLFAGVRTNPFPFTWTVSWTILKSSRYMAQFAAVCIFHVIYYHVLDGRIEPSTVLEVCFGTSASAYLFGNMLADLWFGRSAHFPNHFRKEHLRLYGAFLLFSYQMSPLLRSLTVEISTNTLQYIGGITTLLHLATSFYGIDSFMTSNAISVNSALIGSICCLSRLQSDSHCFAILVLTFQLYVLFPIFGRLFWDSLILFLPCLFLGGFGAYTVSPLTFYLYLVSVLVGSFLLPVSIVFGLKFKHNIYGPWDEAVIEPFVRPTRIKPFDPYR